MLTQGRLQRLVYIAHGRTLARTGLPLTGDRPEAWSYGPVYHRLAQLLAPYGNDPIGRDWEGAHRDWSDLDAIERDVIAATVEGYVNLPLSCLSALTRGEGSPWHAIYADGKGVGHDISHRLIEHQFCNAADAG